MSGSPQEFKRVLLRALRRGGGCSCSCPPARAGNPGSSLLSRGSNQPGPPKFFGGRLEFIWVVSGAFCFF